MWCFSNADNHDHWTNLARKMTATCRTPKTVTVLREGRALNLSKVGDLPFLVFNNILLLQIAFDLT